ncbi:MULTISPECIES: Tn3 family transposase [Micrococcaceae]|uniref:Mobile element protein n=1 Tax=Arthrobacter rhombi TaxID=71253 RepID=A0A1R4FMX4_9MICC|nr:MULTISPECIES: Tn3 family transposase [Micrococcaceae]PCC25342.1 Tn3 family transposase [Glutamicibacter sp. BW78]SJM57102.1 Mobile element protein [Arthrobacter rhombi]
MPVDFLSDEQAARFGRFSGDPLQTDLERFFYLDDADRELIAKRRGDHNRLGFAVQVGTVRFLGSFLTDPLDVPWTVVDYLAAQLGISDPSAVKRYTVRVETANTHAREIRTAYGYRECIGAVPGELAEFVYSRAWTHGEGPTVLFEHATAWLRRERVLLPGVTTLVRVVQSSREAAQGRMHSMLAAAAQQVDAGLPATLLGLLKKDHGQQVSRLEALRAGPTRVSGPELEKALHRVEAVRTLGAGAVDMSEVPAARVRELARYGLGAKAQSLRRLAEPRRSATLVATVAALEAAAVDDALDLFDLLMTTKVLGPSRRAAAAERLAKMPELEQASSILARVGQTLLRVLGESGEQVDVVAAWAALEQVAARDRIADAVAKVGELVPDQRGAAGAMREQMARRFRTVAPFLRLLSTTIPWGAIPVGQQVLDALSGLDGLRGRRRVRREEVDEALVPPAWHGVVFEAAGESEVNRDAWVVCVLEQLRASLRRRDVFALTSTRWSDPRAQLLTGSAWDTAREQALRSLSLEGPVSEHLAGKVEVLDAAWRGLSDSIGQAGPEASLRLVEDGNGRVKLSVTPLDALVIPESLTNLRAQVAGMLPRVDLPEILLEVHSWTGFLHSYTHASGAGARMGDLPLSVAAVLTAQACNVGLTPVVAEGHPALTRDRLGHVEANYVRAETHTLANGRLIEAQSGVPIIASWGGGLLASVDGLRFVVPVRTINAAPNPKYFGRGRGLTWFNAVNDQVSGIGAVVVPGTARDSLYVLDTMLNLDGGPKPEMVASDTASYSDMVFGIFTLLGYKFSPRIADLSDQRLWRATAPGQDPGDYGVLNDIARHKIRLDKISAHWDDMTRVAASLATGTVRAYDVLRTLTRDNGSPSPLGSAILEYGRMAKTLHLLALVDPSDETYRRAINTQLTVQESRHRLARAIFHGRRGQVYQRYREGQEDQLGALGLVLNAVVLWNTRYTDAAIAALREAGAEISENDIARLSPLGNQHINTLGRYAFTAPTPDGLRPLRKQLQPEG